MMAWGEQLHCVTLAMQKASGDTRWGRERDSRKLKKTKTTRITAPEPIEKLVIHLNKWYLGTNELFLENYFFDHGYRPFEHQMRCYMLVLRSYACTQRVADKLMCEETRIDISYRSKEELPDSKLFSTTEREIPEAVMAQSQMYIFRFPRTVQKTARVVDAAGIIHDITNTTESLPINETDILNTATSLPTNKTDILITATSLPTNETDTTQIDDDKYIMMLVLPTKTPVSSVRLFKAVHDITPVGCVLPAHFGIMIKKCAGWRSMQTTPVDNWGQWKHIGLGRDSSQSPFLLRCSVGQASSKGVETPVARQPGQRRFHK